MGVLQRTISIVLFLVILNCIGIIIVLESTVKHSYKKIDSVNKLQYQKNPPQLHIKSSFDEGRNENVLKGKILKKKRLGHEYLCQEERECDLFGLLLFQNEISWRFACGIESAALVHPECSVCLYHNNLTKTEDLQLYSHLRNVKLVNIDIASVYENTPLDFFYNGRVLSKSKFFVKDVLDTLRISLLWKNNGGVYFDLDVIFLRNFAQYFKTDSLFQQEEDPESRHFILNGLQLYYRDSYFLNLLIRRAVGHFQGESAIWGSMGPELVTKTYQNALPIEFRDTVEVQPRELAFLLHYLDYEKALWDVNDENGNELYHEIMNKCVSVHFWRLMFEFHEVQGGGFVKERVQKISESSIISTFYRENCPTTFRTKLLPLIHFNMEEEEPYH